MIPAPRRPLDDRTASETQPVRIAHGMTVTDPGDSQCGDGFRTHRATVHVQPDPIQTSAGGSR